MKVKILLTALMISVLANSAQAVLTTDETSSKEYLYNHGYSTVMVDMVGSSKSKINGTEYITVQKQKDMDSPKYVRFVRRVLSYFDPAIENPDQFMQHDIKYEPTVTDL